jgi:hypothetical protein
LGPICIVRQKADHGQRRGCHYCLQAVLKQEETVEESPLTALLLPKLIGLFICAITDIGRKQTQWHEQLQCIAAM